MTEEPHLTWHVPAVTRQQREKLRGHGGCVVWLTGLSGSGKSTIASLVDVMLLERGVSSFVLDGDNIRHGLNATPGMLADRGEDYARRFGLGFSAEDRQENIRRVGCVAQLFASAGVITLTAFVSPYRADRAAVREVVESARAGDFLEIYVNTPLEICEARDPKGLYRKARAGEISRMTGIDDPYEPPLQPELVLDGGGCGPQELAGQVVDLLRIRRIIP